MLLSSTGYLAPISWYAQALQSGSWQWEAHENYQKGGYRNRCKIAGPNRIELLSIPLVSGKHQSTPIQEVQISYQTDWVRLHRLQIQAAYGRAPFYDFYSPDLSAIVELRPKTLWELNWNLQQQLMRWLQLGVYCTPTSSFQKTYESSTVDLRPRNSNAQLEITPYPQLFQDRHGFLADLSILDLIFCQGPTASLYLRQLVTN